MARPEAELILRLLDEQNRPISWLADQIKRPRQSVNTWLKGEGEPRDDSVWAKMIEIVRGDTAPIGLTTIAAAPTGVLPVLRVGSAGDGGSNAEAADGIEVPIQFIYPDYRCVVIDGTSMVPSLMPGDVAIFRQWPHPRLGLVCAVEISGELFVKEVILDGGVLKLHSHNPTVKDCDIPDGAITLGYLAGFYRDDGVESIYRHNRSGIKF